MAASPIDETQFSAQLFKTRTRELDINDAFFDSLRADYPGFDKWFLSHPDRTCYVQFKEDEKIDGLLILKEEDGPIKDIEPSLEVAKAVKICTFKINPHNTKLGQRFVRLIIKTMLNSHAECAYCTTFEKQEALIKLLEHYGFEKHGEKADTRESAYVKSLMNEKGDFYKDYPKINMAAASFYSLSIKPEYHTQMFPDSILHTEKPDIIEDLPHTNAIQKVYICSMRGVEQLRKGDILFIRRSQPSAYTSAPAKYTSCITSVCTVEEVKRACDFESLEKLYEYTSPYNLFSIDEVRRYYNDRSYAIKMIYNFSIKKPVLNATVQTILGHAPEYWGFFGLNVNHANQILQEGQVYEGFIIH